MMKASFVSTLLALSATTMTSFASPTLMERKVETVEKRQGFIEGLIISAIVGAGSGALKGVIGGERP